MFRKLIPCCLGLFICFGSIGYANNYHLRIGEVLTYKIIVKSTIHGADEVIKVVSKDTYNGRDVYHIHSEMTTVGIVKGLYNYSQVEDLVLDAEELYPWNIKITTKDRSKFQVEEVRFNYAEKKGLRVLTKDGGAPESSEIDLPGFVQDGLSLQFFLRKNQVWNNENKIYFYGHGSVKENAFTVKQASQPIKLECGTYSRYQQINDDESNISVLIADTHERLPIVIKKTANFGEIEMKLVKIN
jgi:hypothetical protein